MPTCVVFDCTSSSKYKHRHESKVHFHTFPNREKSPRRFAQWVSFCRRKNFTPSKSSTICSVHFKESDHDPSQWMKHRLMPNIRLSGPHLKPGVVPTIPPKNVKIEDPSNSENKKNRAKRYEIKERKRIVTELLESSSEPSQDLDPDDPLPMAESSQNLGSESPPFVHPTDSKRNRVKRYETQERRRTAATLLESSAEPSQNLDSDDPLPIAESSQNLCAKSPPFVHLTNSEQNRTKIKLYETKERKRIFAASLESSSEPSQDLNLDDPLLVAGCSQNLSSGNPPSVHLTDSETFANESLVDSSTTDEEDSNIKGVHDCKEKWRNIRSSFLRSLKAAPNGSKPKKPYYLKKHLHFVIPFIKPMSNTVSAASAAAKRSCGPILEIDHDTDSTFPPEPESVSIDYRDVVVKVEDSEPELESEFKLNSELILPDDGEESSTPASLYAATELGEEEVSRASQSQMSQASKQSTSLVRRRKRRTNVGLERKLNDLKSKVRKLETGANMARVEQPGSALGEGNGMRYFLVSLLPEFETMTQEQIRAFKIKVMMLIDEMKSTSK